MPQLSLYLDDSTMVRLKKDASKAKLSLSRFAREKLSQESPSDGVWPAGWFDLYGCWSDLPMNEPSDEPFIPGELDW